MHRRTFLAGTGSIAAAGTGSLTPVASRDSTRGDADRDRPSVSASEPELAPGTETTIDVTATDVAGVVVSSHPDPERVAIEVGGASLSPAPASVYLMHPPAWVWESRTSVEVGLPVVVADDAPPGEYRLEVAAFDEFPEDGIELGEAEDPGAELELVTAEFTITVVEA